jgi:hypothetical protein
VRHYLTVDSTPKARKYREILRELGRELRPARLLRDGLAALRELPR